MSKDSYVREYAEQVIKVIVDSEKILASRSLTLVYDVFLVRDELTHEDIMNVLNSEGWQVNAPHWDAWYRRNNEVHTESVDHPENNVYLTGLYSIATLRRSVLRNREVTKRYEGIRPSVLCYIAMQHVSESFSRRLKAELINLWEDATKADATTFPTVTDSGNINDMFIDIAWQRAVAVVATRRRDPEHFHTKDRGFEPFYEAHIRAAADPNTSENGP